MGRKHKRLLRRDSVRRMKRRLREMEHQFRRGEIDLAHVRQRINSWVAHADHANAENLKRRVLGEATFTRATNGV
ncbi:hypothetical protein NYO91_07465 [Arhodomonas aquaeolei]|uniref:hypothetical protein n=1 Tax=Arhodomonas aquaeolei TaxID=2369 RepID=UPI00216A3B50|nr:hypothetical protein [Arhodomonas aquaeolei]MCS4503915.1 hypothetical protein [Arhodomonas aquaeolei]